MLNRYFPAVVIMFTVFAGIFLAQAALHLAAGQPFVFVYGEDVTLAEVANEVVGVVEAGIALILLGVLAVLVKVNSIETRS